MGDTLTAQTQIVFGEGDIVSGAEFDWFSREVRHVRVGSEQELDCLSLSKYYQSDARRTFREATELLCEGLPVKFTGIGCQEAGLRLPLEVGRVLTERQVTAEVLCHGRTSKLVVDSYIASSERRLRRSVADYHFRDKGGRRNG